MQVRTKATPVWSSEEITYLREFFTAALPVVITKYDASMTGNEDAIAKDALKIASHATVLFMSEKARMKE